MGIRAKLGRFFDRVIGPDEEEKIDAAMDAQEELDAKVRHLKRVPDFRVEVFWDEENGEFEGFIYPKNFDEPLEVSDVSGATPGEVLIYAATLLDSALARRGFRREKRSAEAYARIRFRPKDPKE